jgi:hypothetical protein
MGQKYQTLFALNIPPNPLKKGNGAILRAIYDERKQP